MPPLERRFRAAFTACHGDVLCFARRRTDPERAEDIAAETFLVAWRRITDLPEDPGDARAWLFGIARNCLLNDHRAQRRRDGLLVRLADPATAPLSPVLADTADATALRIDLAAAFSRLSATDQEVLALVIFEQLTTAQVGTVLDLTPGAVRVRLSRARAALRDQLADSTTTSTPALCTSMTTEEVLP